MKRFAFCSTELRDGVFCDLVRSGMKEPSPLKNEFCFERAYSANRANDRPLDLPVE